MLKTDSKKLETRDFISVGIFSLIYAVVAFVIGGVAQMTPVTFPFMPMIVALFTGTVFMLYVAKIPKKGALSILGVIAAILLFITGMFWMMSVFFLVFGLIADFICASADFRSFKRNLLAYSNRRSDLLYHADNKADALQSESSFLAFSKDGQMQQSPP